MTGGGVCVACGDDAISVGTAVCAAAIAVAAKTINASVGTVRPKPDAIFGEQITVRLKPDTTFGEQIAVRLKPDTTLGEQITRTLPG